MKISVITIVKNGLPFLGETIESVLSQTYKNFEYIVVDGNSSDGTIELIQTYDERITNWISSDDGGTAEAFNAGFNLSTGDYILYLNADDALIHSKVLEEVAQKIKELNFPEFVYGDCQVVDRHSSQFLYVASTNFNLNKFLRGQTFPHPSTFTKREYFKKNGLFDPKFRIAMDYEFFLRGIKASRIIHIPILMTKVRNGGVSTINQARVVNEIVSALKKNGYLGNPVVEIGLRFYFWIRRKIRSLLSVSGLYGIFQRIRRKC